MKVFGFCKKKKYFEYITVRVSFYIFYIYQLLDNFFSNLFRWDNCSVSNWEAILLIQKYMQYFNTNNSPSSFAKVWKDMSKELKWKMETAFSLYKCERQWKWKSRSSSSEFRFKYPISKINSQYHRRWYHWWTIRRFLIRQIHLSWWRERRSWQYVSSSSFTHWMGTDKARSNFQSSTIKNWSHGFSQM